MFKKLLGFIVVIMLIFLSIYNLMIIKMVKAQQQYYEQLEEVYINGYVE